jgi:ribonuclease HI
MATCNEAEWNACIWGLRAAISLKATKVLVRSDSKLVVNQIQGEWKVKQPHLQILHQEAHGIASKLRKAGGGLVVKWVPRERNTSADKLANYALDHGSRVWEHPY